MKVSRYVVVLFLFFSLSAWGSLLLKTQLNGISNKSANNNALIALQNLTSTVHPVNNFEFQRFLTRGRRSIRHAIEPYGYFRAKIRTRVIHQGKTRLVIFNVNQGPRIRIQNLDIEISGTGRNFKAFTELKRNLPLKIGDPLNTQAYEKAKQTFFDTAQSYGFFKAKMVQSKIIINYITYHASILIYFNTGPRYRFGAISFSEVPLALSFLRRYLRFHEGEYYDQSKLEQTQEDLAGSPYFTQALITPEPDRAKGLLVPVHVELMAGKARSYIFGIGYGFYNNQTTTDNGFFDHLRGTIGMTFNRVNRYGHRFDLIAQAALNNSRFVSHYYIPGPRPARDLFTLSAGIGQIRQVNANSNVYKASAFYSIKWAHWEQNIGLTYLYENYQYANLFGRPFANNSNYIFPSIQWHNLLSHEELHPKQGYNAALSMAGAPNEEFLDSEAFFQVRADGKVVFTLTKTHTRFIFRGGLGRTFISSIQNLPLSLQLFAGGVNSIRGFSYNSIGPGRNLIVGSSEIQQRIYGNWYVAGFFDIGNVADNNLFGTLNEGTGPGIVWLSPVGSIGLYLAFPISVPNSLSKWRIQFNIGPDL